MILSDTEIIAWAKQGGVEPFDLHRVNPASIDLCWSGRYRLASVNGWSDVIESDVLVLKPGEFYLMDTLEKVSMTSDLCGMIMLKSSLGRRGLEHSHAGFFDPGFGREQPSTATLEIKDIAPWELEIKIGQPIIQLVLMRMSHVPNKDYVATGRYNGQVVPTPEKTK